MKKILSKCINFPGKKNTVKEQEEVFIKASKSGFKASLFFSKNPIV